MNEKTTAQPPKEGRQEVLEEIRQFENREEILENKQRNEERRIHARRLIKHGTIPEGVFPSVSSLSGVEVRAFLVALFCFPRAAGLITDPPKSEDMP